MGGPRIQVLHEPAESMQEILEMKINKKEDRQCRRSSSLACFCNKALNWEHQISSYSNLKWHTTNNKTTWFWRRHLLWNTPIITCWSGYFMRSPGLACCAGTRRVVYAVLIIEAGRVTVARFFCEIWKSEDHTKFLFYMSVGPRADASGLFEWLLIRIKGPRQSALSLFSNPATVVFGHKNRSWWSKQAIKLCYKNYTIWRRIRSIN